MNISPRDIRSATETGVLVTWPNIIDLPIRYMCRTSSFDGAPGRMTQGRICYVRVYIRVETCFPYVHMYTEMRSQHFLPLENSIPRQ